MRRLANVEMRLLQIFATIVDCNGLSNAQAALNIAPSTLSGHLAALEARLGSKLCERGRGGFRLTAEGEETYRAAQALFRAVEGFEAASGAPMAARAGVCGWARSTRWPTARR